MIDRTKIRKYTNDHEEYVMKWFDTHGFSGRVVHQWTTDTLFEVEKDGVTDTLQLTAAHQSTKCDIVKYMNDFERSFNMLCEIIRLKKELEAKKSVR